MKAKNLQSILNEEKGFLFEFLVAQSLASTSQNGESAFSTSVDETLWARLKDYQKSIFQKDKKVFQQLPLLAKETAEIYLKQFFDDQLLSVNLESRGEQGRILGTDLILKGKKKPHLLSLKLCKDHAYINTKSAGIKSFYKKYFAASDEIQKSLNDDVFQSFERLRFFLLDQAGLDLNSNQFEEWTLSTLPGELQETLRQPLLDYYHECITLLYDNLLKTMKQQGIKAIHQSFIKLCGLDSDINQLFCLHTGTQSYELNRVVHLNAKEISSIKPQIIAPTRGSSYFLINYENKLSLQIRVKPMRDFTAPSMKINCSVKLHE